MSGQPRLSPITFTPKIAAGLDDALQRLLVRPRHDDHVGRPGLRHHLRLEVAAVHRLQIGHDRHAGKRSPQGPHAVQAFREDQRRAGLQPVNARPARHRGGRQGFSDIGQIEGNLHYGGHGVGQELGLRRHHVNARPEIPSTRPR
jgi:hypothetical protein